MPDISTERHGAVLLLTLTRPGKRNAITSEMFTAMSGELHRAADDDTIGAVVLAAAGNTFSAGIDLATLGEPREDLPPSNTFLRAVAAFPKPLIAAVGGPAIGVGFTITLMCHLVYAAANASFRAPFVPMGLVPEAGSTVLLPAQIGMHRAADMLLFGETLGADEALSIGLVNEIVPAHRVLPRALERAEQLCALDLTAVRQTLSLLGLGKAARAQMEIENPIFESLLRARLGRT
jgi:enoyl-CoA hydratase/carnithine racemase